jgi:cytochrome c553
LVVRRVLFALAGCALLAGCHTDMWVQPRLEAQRGDAAGPQGMASRPVIPGTVPYGQARTDDRFFRGRENGRLIDTLPAEQAMRELNVSSYRDLILRGQDRFYIFCSPCHGQVGDGTGMIAQRGLDLRRKPATFHTERLRNMPDGHFYDVITNGYGVMFSYASRIEPADRWAITAYIRALQLSQNQPPQPNATQGAAGGGAQGAGQTGANQ